MPIIRAFWAIIRRDLLLAFRRRAEMANPLFFFVLVVTLFPLAVGAQPNLLRAMAPGVIWVSALLAALLSLDGLFRSDFDDGSLEQMLLSPHALSILVLGKIIAHWLVTGLPLLLIAPLLAVFLGLPEQAMGTLWLTLILATPLLSLIGAIGVALTVGLRRGGMLLSLLVLPLYVPVLIFASGAVDRAASGLPVGAQLNILLAMLLSALVLVPLPTAAALKMSVN
ncbi:heme exporter protein CcmB [Methylomonas fluvii]|uniref:Heme exporter protein B n=1 Tax=Methylomonas fluvii TaxID=1854564 RepID=A0ABR9DHT1_9GAMM|nr:heme exporter protein CcmB [Methylomonas fluvii]MBD9362667.1 heme exporter protein CcmB [Methylomonas fluvii]CAD6875793.1 ABC transporter involved in cytochrome c biogenesis, CcmB subunit [Methylomonas fluvii]